MRPAAGPDGAAAVRVPVHLLRVGQSPRRGGEDPEHVQLLAETEGELPPITVLKSSMEVVDGAHRLSAARLRGDRTIPVRFFDGDPADAFVHSVRVNVRHGLPLSQADRTAAAARIIASHPDWSDRKVAAISGLSSKVVASLRRSGPDRGDLPARVGLDGKSRPLDPVQGRERAAALITSRPGASLREIAAAAGIGLGTAKDVRDRLRRGQDVVPPKLRGVRVPVPRSDGLAAVRALAPADHAVDERFNELFEELCKDPALRFSEVGRTLLRLLGAHRIDEAEWSRFVESVPAHCGDGLVRAAGECARMWARFGHGLAGRAQPAEVDVRRPAGW
ncbi:ParB/RepB/Spo0J family partition protein [Actinosynnema sp. NPDC023587]|uniref:ParB/RepB/Spo0J family partition protein n=1 Tax=Actinosynnema sp. NPDC023587 TaxID=3154695 RepID=UPI0033F6E980